MIKIVFGRAVQFLLALAMMRVATTLLLPEEMGKVSLILTTTAFFAMFLVNPVGMFINRRLHSWQASGAARFYLERYAFYLMLVTAIAAVILLGTHLLGLIRFATPVGWLILLVCGSLFFNTINQTSIPSLNMLGAGGRFVLLSIATIGVSFVCAVLLVMSSEPIAQYWVLGLLLGQAALALIGTKALFELLKNTKKLRLKPDIKKQHLLALFKFAWPVSIAAALGWVQSQGYRYVLGESLGLTQLGLFVAGYGISAGMIAGFESVLTTYFQPRLYRDANLNEDSDKQAKAWHRYAMTVIPSLIFTVALIMILAPELTQIFLGKNFRTASDFVVWGATAEAMRVVMGVYTLIAHVYMNTRWLIVPNIIGALLSILLCMLLIPIYGGSGVGLGLTVSGLATIVAAHLLLAKRVGGISTYPIIKAIVYSLALWGLAVFLRQLTIFDNWVLVLSTLLPVGAVYLGLQYMTLKKYLKKEGGI